MKTHLLAFAAAIHFSVASFAVDRPNILWISCEDISPHLGCYGDSTARTPNLDHLAKEGIRYTNAFSCHGVCAPSRTGIITANYPIALGANHMRSRANLPPHVKLFPQYLRQAGYYCTNNSKTDYNLNWDQKATWDESSGKAHWKNRQDKNQPFFSVFNLTMTHESKVWKSGWQGVVTDLKESDRHRPEDMIVPPLYPDTETVREDLARIADIITVMDQKVGQLLHELDDAGLAENTIVMFWSDHGDGLPRAKRWPYDSGTKVPMIVRVPEKYKAQAVMGTSGSTDDRLINLIDLGPTALSMAGVELPEGISGQPFLGPRQPPAREFIYGARDRVDERFDLVRTVRNRNFRYVRNLMPWRPALQNITYSEQNSTRQEMRKLLAEEKLAPQSAQWFKKPRAAEELYDLNADPWELVNLAKDPAHEATLKALSAECDRWQLDVRDAHLLPEVMLDAAEQKDGSRWMVLHGSDGMVRTEKLLNAAKATARTISDQTKIEMPQLDPDPAVRWWQVMACSKAPNVGAFKKLFEAEVNSDEPAIRIAAAGGLARLGDMKTAAATLGELLSHKSIFVQHAAMLEIDEAGPDLIALTKNQIETISDNEYCQRLADHALNR